MHGFTAGAGQSVVFWSCFIELFYTGGLNVVQVSGKVI